MKKRTPYSFSIIGKTVWQRGSSVRLPMSTKSFTSLFSADNIEALIRLLENGFGVQLATRGDDTIVYSRRR